MDAVLPQTSTPARSGISAEDAHTLGLGLSVFLERLSVSACASKDSRLSDVPDVRSQACCLGCPSTYDRRGFGRSSKTGVGDHYDTFAADLDKLLKKLNLRKVDLVGFSMGTGEVTRYIGKYGTQRVRRAVLIGSIRTW